MKTKKLNKKNIMLTSIFVLMALLLIFTTTLAYFTVKSLSLEDNIDFAKLTINVSPNASGLITSTTGAQINSSIIPGDDVSIKFSVENAGTEDVWALAYIEVLAEDKDGNDITSDMPIQTGAFQVKSTLTSADVNPSAPSHLEKGTTTAVTYSGKIDLLTEDEFQEAQLTVKVTIYAIQYRHLEAADALTELNELIEKV